MSYLSCSILALIVAFLLACCFLPMDLLLPEPRSAPSLVDLPEDVQKWFQRGQMYKVCSGHSMFSISEGSGTAGTVVLIHGFPTSSFDYHKTIDILTKQDFRVVSFDHIGFGFSDKPREGFVYSMADHAENALDVLRQLNVSSAHIVAHDMGDSVLTEILARLERGSLPDRFQQNFFQSITFTNGGMRYDLIKFRLAQRLLLLPTIGAFLSSLSTRIPLSWAVVINRHQLGEIWGDVIDAEERNQDMYNIFAINNFKNGTSILHKTITYLTDRQRFEVRWLSSLAKLEMPIQLFWGDSDAVSPLDIPQSLADDFVSKDWLTTRYLQGAGHFTMLERPQEWTNIVTQFIKANQPQM